MRNVTGLSFLYGVAVAVALGLCAERVNAQEEAPLPATSTLPPDVQEREKAPKPPAHLAKSPELDELLQQLGLTHGDIERRKADKAERELPAAADVPLDVKERKKVEKSPAPPTRSPDFDDLIEKIRKQPGGAEKLEHAKRAGARIPPGKAGGATLEWNPKRMPGPRVEGLVVGLPSTAEQQPTLIATRSASYQNVTGLGALFVADVWPTSTNISPVWGYYSRVAVSNDPVVGNLDVKPYMVAGVKVTNAGWYLINFVATRGKASLRKYDPASRSYPVMTQWDNSASANYYESYPYLVNLAAGYHYFDWIPEVGRFYVSEVSVIKL